MGRAYQNKKDSMAKTAGAKTKVYSKYGKEIYVINVHFTEDFVVWRKREKGGGLVSS